MLEQLAGLAEKARAAKPVGASPTAIVSAGPVIAPVEKPEPAGLLPASDRFVDFVRALVGKRPLVLGVVGLTTILLLGLVIWLGWRGNDGTEKQGPRSRPVFSYGFEPGGECGCVCCRKSDDARPADHPLPNHPLPSHSLSDRPSDPRVAGQRVPDNDSVWKPNPGGQLLDSSGKPSAARTVKTAAELDAAEAQKNKATRSASATGAASAPAQQSASGSNSGLSSGLNSAVKDNSSAASHGDETAALGPPPLAVGQSSSALSGVLSSKALMPSLSARVSEGISGGQLIHRVPPVYPLQAKSLRMEGKVVLDAVVMEDGSVRDLKVVEGPPVFTAPAMEAVKKWRYKPFVLDGKAVKSPMRIMVDFKLPSTL